MWNWNIICNSLIAKILVMKKINSFSINKLFFIFLLGLQIKISAGHNSIETIVFYRSLIGTIILYFYFFYKKKFVVVLIKNIKFHILRSLFRVCQCILVIKL